MKKILTLVAVIATLTLTGCNDGSSTPPPPPPQPQPPVIIQPTPEPEPTPTIPTAGVGSIKGDLTCNGGTITTNYSFGNVEDDSKEFVIQYQRNGETVDLTYPSTSTTGSRTIVKDIYYVGQNDDDTQVFWIVTIIYQSEGETYNLVTATITQPKCTDRNAKAVTTFEIK